MGHVAPAEQGGERAGVEARALGEAVTALRRKGIDVEYLYIGIDQAYVARVTKPQPNGSRGGQILVTLSLVSRRAVLRRPSRMTEVSGAAHPPAKQ